MSRQFIRRVSLVVAPEVGTTALDLSEAHFNFLIKRGDLQTPNSMTCRVYNLSDETVHAFGSDNSCGEFNRVVLQVGYEGLGDDQPYLAVIFDGSIKYTNTGHESAIDSYLEIIGADGDSAYNFAVVNITLAGGSTPSDHIDQYAASMSQLPNPTVPGSIPSYNQQLPRAKVLFGKARDLLRYTAETVQATWSIQDGQLELVPVNGVLENQVIELNSETGMVGFPERTPSGIHVRCLLNPMIKINSRIKINNSEIQGFNYGLGLGDNLDPQLLGAIKTDADGIYRVLWIEHLGDTRANTWYSDIICVAIDQSYQPLVKGVGAIAPDEVVYIPK